MVLNWFARDPDVELTATIRDKSAAADLLQFAPNASLQELDAESANVKDLAGVLHGAVAAINCIGVIKPYIKDTDATQVERAIRVNSLFPHTLASVAQAERVRVLQIATDCVYSGTQGGYVEASQHDALDIYGKSKSMGEVHSPFVHHLRCSIIGPELRAHVSLLDWFLGQKQGAQVKGFLNHDWNGVTTLHFGKLCYGIIKNRIELPHLQHLVPAGAIHKAQLLRVFAEAYRRSDIEIQPINAPTVIDRTLNTTDHLLNEKIWRAAGYGVPPTVEQMVKETAEYEHSRLRAKVAYQN